jgi:hypothetical protein
VGWWRDLMLRWGARKFELVCPHCRTPASDFAFKRGRYMLGDQELSCEQCGQTSRVTLWRFEGLSDPPAGCGRVAKVSVEKASVENRLS